MTAKPEIAGPVPPKAQYICWVQRSLIRNGWPGLAVDANDSAHYRDTVKRFQNENTLPVPIHGEVDPLTQNKLVKLNHTDTDYTAWVQAALVKSGLLKAGVGRTDPIMDLQYSPTRQAIRRFQQARSLKSDGWVGPKTELALTKFSTTAPPGDTGTPAPCKPARPRPPPRAIDDDLLIDKLRRAQRLSGMRMAAGAACSQPAAVAAKHLFVLRDTDRIEDRPLLDVTVSLG